MRREKERDEPPRYSLPRWFFYPTGVILPYRAGRAHQPSPAAAGWEHTNIPKPVFVEYAPVGWGFETREKSMIKKES